MQEENLNNMPWKNKLNEAAFSDEILPDKDAAWQKLHSRLHQRTRTKKRIWYWIAAACLIVFVSIPFLFVQRATLIMVKNTISKKSNTETEKRDTATLKKDTIEIVQTIPVIKKKTIKTRLNYNSDTSNSSTIEIAAKKAKLPEVIADNIDTIYTSVESNPTPIIATAQVKRKLRVVHINELGDPVETSGNVTHNTEPHSFELKLANQEVLNNNDVAYSKSHFAIIKIKPTTTN